MISQSSEKMLSEYKTLLEQSGAYLPEEIAEKVAEKRAEAEAQDTYFSKLSRGTK